MTWLPPEGSLLPRPPANLSTGIGLVGCGEIMNIAHLPAYARANLNLVGCFDVDRTRAEETAQRFSIPKVYSSLQACVADPTVTVLDIAIHYEGRDEIIELARQHRKHVLIQKPVAQSMQVAERFVQTLESAQLKCQVNQQARWAGTHMLVKYWIECGAIGTPNRLKLDVRGWQDDPATWYVRADNFTILDHGIHYFDLLTWLAGREAERIAAINTMIPNQVSAAPLVYSTIIDFGGGLIAEHSFHNKVEASTQWSLSLIVDGDEGSVSCDFESAKLDRRDGTLLESTPESKWFPDAFLGPMADLIDAIDEDREPTCSGRSNLASLGLALAAVRSSDRGGWTCVGGR